MDTELTDVGAQAERTALAWQRTGIGAMAVGALLMRGHVHQHLLPPWPGLLLTVVAGVAVLVLVPQRYRRVLRAVRAGHTPLSRAMVPGATLVLVLVTIGIGAELLRA
ncbi:DUF202 domain-containing protein [Mycobacterium sp.]|uniref:DUF202 domain-containing protein n=1 Tax=Mycobacterium sp. TaxID=1785 RepID=UPI002C2C1D89|nr:DUF202 domain-containing protein [Mycobacterium sp.]HME46596.1 DUF202 domain-containing protein [Mycobacterium sp.]